MASKYYNLSTDTTLGGNSPSDYTIPSEKAIKTYVDNNSGGGGGTLYDGQWVNSFSELFNGSWAASGEKSFDLATYLPDDSYKYEVFFGININTGSSTGNRTTINAYTSELGDSTYKFTLCSINTRAASIVTCGGTAIIPIGTDRKLNTVNTGTAGSVTLQAFGYRRIGTNT